MLTKTSDYSSRSASDLTWNELRSYAKQIGVSAGGSRTEIESRIAANARIAGDEKTEIEELEENQKALDRQINTLLTQLGMESDPETESVIKTLEVKLMEVTEAIENIDRFNFEDKKFNPQPFNPQPQPKPNKGTPIDKQPATPKKVADSQGLTLALANLARALKNATNGVAVFPDTFKVLAIAQHFPEIYPGIWKAEFQGEVIGYLQKNVDGYTGYKECPVREPDLNSPTKGKFWVNLEPDLSSPPNGKFWGDAATQFRSYKVARVVTAKLSKASVHTVITDSQRGISCDCQGFFYRQHCCHVEAVNRVLRPQEQITQEIKALKVRAELIQEIRDRKLWDLLSLIKPSVLNASLGELKEGNILLTKELQNTLALNNVLSA